MRLVVVVLIMFCGSVSFAQSSDTVTSKILTHIKISGIRTVRGIGHMPEYRDGIIYAGKKNEVLLVDSLDANKAINNTRQILGRVPGLNITETETGGFTANGIATRGLNPNQSIEMNTRQNGYNISADVYGYNEAYYIPPMEAVSRVEMIRGAASLQFGAQFGGMVNYVINDPVKNKPFEFYTSQTGGSFGLLNSFNAVSGTLNKVSYYGFVQFRNMTGWRPNSGQQQFSAFGKVQYIVSPRLNTGVEYSLLRNRIKMPGGLTDSMFTTNARSSFRSRNWLKSPWNILAGYANYTLSPSAKLSIKTTYLFSKRALVWKNEEGGAGAMDDMDPVTHEYVNREVENESMHNSTTEARVLNNYTIGKSLHTLSGGIRYAYAWFKRQGGGKGSTGTDFDLKISGKYEYDLDFTTTNIAPFVENIFRIGDKISIIPGMRLEYLRSSAKGYKMDNGTFLITDENRTRKFLLAGIGGEIKTSLYSNMYANISQAYRPIDYSQLTAFGLTSKIDPNLKDATGYNADLGYRSTIKNYLNFDIGLFYLRYNNRIGTILLNPGTSQEYTLRTNVANSLHAGIESYIEFNVLKYLHEDSKNGLSIFNSFSYIDAKYTSGAFKNLRVEAAARYINRIGLNYAVPLVSITFQLNNVGDAYGDASNIKVSDNPVAGYIPSYSVADISSTFTIHSYRLKFGINNFTNSKYFTRRTDEYPGPGIIPSTGRGYYIGVAAKF